MGSLLPQALLPPLEAHTPGPERFLITAKEPNYLHVLGSRDSGPPQGPNPGLCSPTRISISCGFASLFAYIYIWPLRLTSNITLEIMEWPCPSALATS